MIDEEPLKIAADIIVTSNIIVAFTIMKLINPH